jgi:hypothetical protein
LKNQILRKKILNSNSNPDSVSAKIGTVSGWGLLNETGYQGSNTLQFVSLPILTDDVCIKAYGQMVSFDPSLQFCAGNNLGQDACSGDSGEILMISLLICVLLRMCPIISKYINKQLLG